jgi:hypothetical protein
LFCFLDTGRAQGVYQELSISNSGGSEVMPAPVEGDFRWQNMK